MTIETQAEQDQAHEFGRQDAKRVRPMKSNPYDSWADTRCYAAYERGWRSGIAERDRAEATKKGASHMIV